ncbi:hypothetical protein M409DRAFT_22577 [Zasmidium cellare ATCC 36951]|uniref:Uncharacterized protein n=1 Tax=Zasmidium cellare ATCC 36951 TaxID=1080233 RepID=A0A6A6CIT8_ZASCE|nr:uncharacterized protein M409DRAFT_22577 [Zasmidium cellare ATCC 36951]KAF2167147.1 hypothetical protein M409DRAFT_22577 [Zasmidium cellare ATCC 36951]
MKFLERSHSARMKKDEPKGAGPRMGQRKVAEHQPRRDVFESIDEAVAEHRKSLGKRPNTAAGLEKRKRSLSKARTAAREVKEPTCSEDLHLVGQTLEYKDGLDTFRFPTPSPRLPPPPRSATFHHSPSPLQQHESPLQNYESPKIGIAIGSPSNAPPSWGRSFTADHISTRMHQPPNRAPPRPPGEDVILNQSPEQRRKKSSWKTLGTIFRWTSKSTQAQRPTSPGDPPAPCSPIIRTLAPSEAPSPVLPSPKPVSNKQHRRMHSGSPSLHQGETRPESRSEVDRTSFMPALKARISRVPYTRGSSTPSPRLKTHRYQDSEDIFSPKEQDRHDSPISSDNKGMEALSIARTPRLEVTFERPEFERYSVMFEKLLSNDSKPSLLERRQSRLQRKKSGKRPATDEESCEDLRISTHISAIPQRSLTSPHLSRSLSIKVEGRNVEIEGMTAQGPSTAIHRPRPLVRSNTAPPGAVSPVTAAFKERKSTLESSPESPGSAFFSEASIPTPTTVTTCTDRESIHKELEQSEPAWDMITSVPVKVVSPPGPTPETGKGKGKAPEPYPRVKSPKDLERQIVQVSVARQVSVSRARSRVQKAVATSSFKQPLRPRVVELSRNRKSTVGVLENSDDIPSVPSREGSKAESDIEKEPDSQKIGSTGHTARKGADEMPPIPTIEVSDAEGDVMRQVA